jgi:hypothetical protein
MLGEKTEDRAVAHAESARFHQMNYAPTDLNPKKDLPALLQRSAHRKPAPAWCLPVEIGRQAAETLPDARRIAEELIVQGRHSPI